MMIVKLLPSNGKNSSIKLKETKQLHEFKILLFNSFSLKQNTDQ